MCFRAKPYIFASLQLTLDRRQWYWLALIRFGNNQATKYIQLSGRLMGRRQAIVVEAKGKDDYDQLLACCCGKVSRRMQNNSISQVALKFKAKSNYTVSLIFLGGANTGFTSLYKANMTVTVKQTSRQL